MEAEAVALPYFYTDIDAYEAEKLLKDKPHGTFLLRYSGLREFFWLETPIALSFVCDIESVLKRVWHIRIEIHKTKCCFEDDFFEFNSVPELIEYYSLAERCCTQYLTAHCFHPMYRHFTLQELCVRCIRMNKTYLKYLPITLKRMYDLL